MPNARLIIVSPDQPDREIMLDGGASIGRAFDNTVCIASAGVSRYHAVIEQRADGFWLSDLDSINGTAVNGDPVTSERKLNEGDVIAVGEGGEIRFHLDDTGLKPAQEMAQPPASVDTPDEAPRPQEAPPVEPKAPPAKRSALLIFGAVAAGLAVTIVVALVILSSKSGGDVATARGGASASVAAQKNTEAKSGRESPAGSTAPEPVAPAPTSGETSVSGAIMSDLSARGDTNVAALAQNLAGLIVRKSGYGYTFAPHFVAQIRRRPRSIALTSAARCAAIALRSTRRSVIAPCTRLRVTCWR